MREATRTMEGVDLILHGLLIEIVLVILIGIVGAIAVRATQSLHVALFFLAGIVGALGLGVRRVNTVSARYELVFRTRRKALLHVVPAIIGLLMMLVILLAG